MKSRDALIRLKRFEVEKCRKVAEIKTTINEFNQMAADLDRQISIEQERAGVSDINHYSYPTSAKAAIQRRNNLLTSAADLQVELANAAAALDEAREEMRDLLEGRDAEQAPPPPPEPGMEVLRDWEKWYLEVKLVQARAAEPNEVLQEHAAK